MSTFIIKIKQIRKADGFVKERSLITQAVGKHAAIRQAIAYAKGYYQYEPPYFIDVYLELGDGDVISVESLGD